MASSITSAASFATSNMKPVSGEQIDALWGQNIADNTGYLYYRVTPGPVLSLHRRTGTFASGDENGMPCEGTAYFYKAGSEHATFCGSYSGFFNNNVSKSHKLQIQVDGINVVSTTFGTASGAGIYYSGSFATVISAKANAAFYTVIGTVGTQAAALDMMVDMCTITTWLRG